ncbi:VOC family protein [Kribbella sancticallisti]|uniref:VOC family protein n=1 Tax=Kribbella sancticallisti TaxID=460087 RepID=A0ABN2EB36_9ACTN
MNYLVPVVEAVVVDCVDPVAVAKFWQQLMGGELVWTDDGDVDLQGGPVRLYFQRVAHDAKRGKNPLHLDLRVPHDAHRQAIDRALSLGATLAHDVYDGHAFQVLRDPAGNEFCLIWN